GDEGVERVTLVGDLHLPVFAFDRAEVGGFRAFGAGRRALGGYRRPEGCAFAVAGGFFALVLLEDVDGLAFAVGQHRAEPVDFGGEDFFAAAARGLRFGFGRAGAGAAATAAAGDEKRPGEG